MTMLDLLLAILAIMVLAFGILGLIAFGIHVFM